MMRKGAISMLSKKAIVLIILVLYLFINLWLGIRTSRKSAKENADKGFLSNYFFLHHNLTAASSFLFRFRRLQAERHIIAASASRRLIVLTAAVL